MILVPEWVSFKEPTLISSKLLRVIKRATISPLNPLSTGPFTIVTEIAFFDASIDSAVYKYIKKVENCGFNDIC